MLPPKFPNRPIQMSGFRMTAEKMVARFVESGEGKMEFPPTLTKDQRIYIEELCFKTGLKSKRIVKERTYRLIIFKGEDSTVKAIDNKMELRNQSLKVLHKMLEILNDKSQNLSFPVKLKGPSTIERNQLLTSVSRGCNSVITIPPASVNPQCVELRKKLPIYKHRETILDLIKYHQVVVIESTTGSGKSTQIPQYLLEAALEDNQPCRVIVAEPKRICAISLANRVSFERGEDIGSTVGYQIRLESKVAPSSNLIYVTNGVILRMLMSGKPDEFFNGITAIVIDEVHERDKFADFLLLCVRFFLPQFPKVKVIIMSATLESEIFSNYFGGCPVLRLEGSAFEVDEKFLEDVLKLVEFSNELVVDLNKNFAEDPSKLKRKRKLLAKEKNLDDDTKDAVNELLEVMSKSDDCDTAFFQFFYMVQADHVPVDFRHIRTNKTALMFAVGHGLKVYAAKLLDMKANPMLSYEEVNGSKLNSFDIAAEKNIPKLTDILIQHTVLVKGDAVPAPSGAKETSNYDRMLLDIYYGTLVHPGVHRGIFLEDIVDVQLIVRLVHRLHFSTDHANGILIFLPGHDEIVQVANLLIDALDNNYEMFILHSQMQTANPTSVFDKMPDGVRKIVLATNIAESSITVDDVVFVIDSGKEKCQTFNATNHISCLLPQWTSKASAKQRKGRAGRLCSGTVFRLYSRDRFNNFVDNAKPEFLRCDITDICLQTKMIEKNCERIGEFLQKAITPPTDVTIRHTVKLLQDIGALQHDESLTQLGLYLADIPLNAKYAKMLIFAILFKCIDPVLTLVSILSTNEPFTLSLRADDREKCHALKCKLEDGSFSDHFVMLRIFQKWNEYKTALEYDGGFCEDNFVNAGTMERIATTRLKIVGYLRSVRLLNSVGNLAAINEHSNNWAVVKACLTAGSYPDIAQVNKKRGEIVTALEDKLLVNPGSVLRTNLNKKLGKKELEEFPGDWMIFEEKNLAGGLGMAKSCTLVTGLTVALTAGHGICVYEETWSEEGGQAVSNSELSVDDFIKFVADPTLAQALQEVRQKLNTLVERFLLNVDKFRMRDQDNVLIAGIAKLLELEDQKAGFNIHHEGIGNRPRVITRERDVLKERVVYMNDVRVFPVASCIDQVERFAEEVQRVKLVPTNVQMMQKEPPKVLKILENVQQQLKKPSKVLEVEENVQSQLEDPSEVVEIQEDVPLQLEEPTNVADVEENAQQLKEPSNVLEVQESVPPQPIQPSKVFEIKESKNTRAIRYLMVEMKPESIAKHLKPLRVVRLDGDAQLSHQFIDAIIEMEINDRISQKIMVFHSDKEIVGVGMLLNRNCDLDRENMRMFFQSEDRLEIAKLMSALPPTSAEKLFKKPFAEIPRAIGELCVDVCSMKFTSPSN